MKCPTCQLEQEPRVKPPFMLFDKCHHGFYLADITKCSGVSASPGTGAASSPEPFIPPFALARSGSGAPGRAACNPFMR